MLLGATPRFASGQERGAIALGEAVAGLGVNARVLMIGAHPDDEDTNLIAWLSRGRHVATGYLSLTRGDGGQNLIGNELGELLGVIRTEELLAARRIDGGEQYFTRAFDFGFSKDTIDTYAHWSRDSILGDVVRVVRAMRPHVIVAVFSGTPRDGHGQHQVSGVLAREAYDLAGDTVRFPRATYGAPWTPLKFYRAARFNPQQGTLGMDVGEYSPLLGRSYAEIAGESRSQHRSQGFGAPQRKGPVMDYLRREASRVNDATPAASEKSLFDGIDTSWARFRAVARPMDRLALDSLRDALTAARAAFDAFFPSGMIKPLGLVERLARDMEPRDGDLASSRAVLLSRVWRALKLASGVDVEALARRPVEPVGEDTRVVITTHNRGRDTIWTPGPIAPSTSRTDSTVSRIVDVTQPEWLKVPRIGAMFARPASVESETLRSGARGVAASMGIRGAELPVSLLFVEPVVYRSVDAVKGEIRQLAAAAPAISVTIDAVMQYMPANAAIDRPIVVRLRAAGEQPRDVRVTLTLPAGLQSDSAARTVRLGGSDAEAAVTFRVRGRIRPGQHRVTARAESDGASFARGYQLVAYDHIEPQRVYRPAEIVVSAVDVSVPASLRVAYVPGVGDNIVPALQQLGILVTVIAARELGNVNLAGFSTLVIGPRAYEANPDLVTQNARIVQFARDGGTVVVQYGQYELTEPGILPYPIAINRPHDRVTHEDAPVTVLEPGARELTWPNRVSASDFGGWVQERSLYMPRTFDAQWRPLLAMSDPAESPNRGSLLVAQVGTGKYVYTSLAFFRQLPAGVPGAARLFVNLLSAGLPTRVTP